MKRQVKTPILVGFLVADTIAVIAIIIASSAMKQPAPLENLYPDFEIEFQKSTYHVGEHLDFNIHTYGICATPNVNIWRDEGAEGVMVYQYMGSPFSCPPPTQPDQPHMIWSADQLVQRISDENFGGNGDSVIATNAAISLKKAGNYTVSASLIDQSKSVSSEITVTDVTY